jgi:hypothetical protein
MQRIEGLGLAHDHGLLPVGRRELSDGIPACPLRLRPEPHCDGEQKRADGGADQGDPGLAPLLVRGALQGGDAGGLALGLFVALALVERTGRGDEAALLRLGAAFPAAAFRVAGLRRRGLLRFASASRCITSTTRWVEASM